MATKKKDFKGIGQGILKPGSLKDLMGDSEETKENTEMHTYANTDIRKNINTENVSPMRVNTHIAKDLYQKMEKMLYDSKVSPEEGKRVTRRTIIEDALSEYFKKRGY